jgi:hypothetical protein
LFDPSKEEEEEEKCVAKRIVPPARASADVLFDLDCCSWTNLHFYFAIWSCLLLHTSSFVLFFFSFVCVSCRSGSCFYFFDLEDPMTNIFLLSLLHTCLNYNFFVFEFEQEEIGAVFHQLEVTASKRAANNRTSNQIVAPAIPVRRVVHAPLPAN